LWFWPYPKKAIILIVLGSWEVILPYNLIVKEEGECPNLDVTDKRVKVKLSQGWPHYENMPHRGGVDPYQRLLQRF
jgi:hypothetical protein